MNHEPIILRVRSGFSITCRWGHTCEFYRALVTPESRAKAVATNHMLAVHGVVVKL